MLREGGTEPAGQGKFCKFFPPGGFFCCRACASPLYAGKSKFKRGRWGCLTFLPVVLWRGVAWFGVVWCVSDHHQSATPSKSMLLCIVL